MRIRARYTTGVSFWEKVSTYTAGEGPTTAWAPFLEGEMSVFPCEWKNNFISGKNRNETFAADAEGNLERASIRMPYIPRLYEKLRSGSVVAIKGGDQTAIVNGEPNPANLNVYSVFAGVDDIYEENRVMQFYVKRYEAKG